MFTTTFFSSPVVCHKSRMLVLPYIFLSFLLLSSSAHRGSAAEIERFRRQSRQNQRRPKYVSPAEYRRLLENFWPKANPRCKEPGAMLCYDQSYCFDDKQLCSGQRGCNDDSNNINAICLGRTTPEVTTTRATLDVTTRKVTPQVTGNDEAINAITTASGTQVGEKSTKPETVENIDIRKSDPGAPQFSAFSHPVVISFFVLIGGLLAYVCTATLCCVSAKWNSVNPKPLVPQSPQKGKSCRSSA